MNDRSTTDAHTLRAWQPPAGWPSPRSAYVHVPFCRHRCGYCNFSVVAGRDDLIDRYLRAIDLELATWGRPSVDTLFIGGGTPTHLTAGRLDRFLRILQDRIDVTATTEFSIEANPEDIDDATAATLAGAGVNRISLGVQSFDGDKLVRLERSHDRRRAIAAIRHAAARIGNVSIDLIFGTPGETASTWRRDLDVAMSLPIDHLSTYSLTIEKGTRFFASSRDRRWTLPDEDVELQMYDDAITATAKAGWSHYEVSSFSRPGRRCRHNLAYWNGMPWSAAGPGAARFVDGRREVNHRSVTTYLRRIESGHDTVAERESLSQSQYAAELAAFGLRMIDGIDLAVVGRRADVAWQSHFARPLAECGRSGWIRQERSQVRLTDAGIRFADSVASAFLSTGPSAV